MTSFHYKCIVVVGTTSSGKSTLAKQLADKFGYDFIELDALHWEPNWTEAPDDVFHERVDEATQKERWVVAGNYSKVRSLIWSRAEAVIWLDYSLWRIFLQLTRRTITRWWTREHLWGTNYENLWTHFKLWSEESLFHWLLKTYWRRKREYPMLLAMPEHQHLKLIRFKHPNETSKWLNSL
ncbi:MAG TPA: shikimate kinase [Anaerolineales bacterium]